MAKNRKHTSSEKGATSVHDFRGEITPISLQKLRYDPQNPRFAERLGPKPTQGQIEQLLLGTEMKARELVPSFMENGYIPYEHMIVRPEGETFTVVEGNRRLAALRYLSKSDDPVEKGAFHKHSLSEVPCLIFAGDDRQLLAYLGLRHLSKTKDWTTSAKGAFVERVLKAGHPLAEAGRLTNTTTQSLRLILLTRRLFEQAGNLGLQLLDIGADGETVFWHLGDAVRRSRTKAYLRLEENPDPLQQPNFDQTRFEYLVGWLYGSTKTRQLRAISSIRDIAILDQCLGNERATKALENGATLAEAHEELEAAGAGISGHLGRAKRSVERASGGPWSDLDKAGLDEVETAAKHLEAAMGQIAALISVQRKRLS
jgi:ParB-like chromosome segregation protein Spo0J